MEWILRAKNSPLPSNQGFCKRSVSWRRYKAFKDRKKRCWDCCAGHGALKMLRSLLSAHGNSSKRRRWHYSNSGRVLIEKLFYVWVSCDLWQVYLQVIHQKHTATLKFLLVSARVWDLWSDVKKIRTSRSYIDICLRLWYSNIQTNIDPCFTVMWLMNLWIILIFSFFSITDGL